MTRSPGQDILGKLGCVDSGAEFVEISAGQVFKDILDVPLPLSVHNGQNPTQKPESVGTTGTAQIAYPAKKQFNAGSSKSIIRSTYVLVYLNLLQSSRKFYSGILDAFLQSCPRDVVGREERCGDRVVHLVVHGGVSFAGHTLTSAFLVSS